MQEPFSVNNHKISARQIHRTLTLELLGISTLLLPSRLASTCGVDGIFALAVGGAGAVVLLMFWSRRYQKNGFQERLRSINPVIRTVFRIFYGAGFAGIAGYVLYLMTGLIEEQLLGRQKETVIVVTLSLIAFFGLLRGMECRVRVYEVLYWFLLIPLLIILGIARVGTDVTAWTPVLDSDAGAFLKSCYLSFLFFSGTSLYICFLSACQEPEAAYRGTRRSLYLLIGCNLAVYLILLGVFQRELLAHRRWPVIDLMAVVKLPGNFLERQDALMIGIWFFCLFAFLESMLYYAVDFLSEAVCVGRENGKQVLAGEDVEKKEQTAVSHTNARNRQEKKRMIMTGILVGIVAGIACLLLGWEHAAETMFYGYMYGVWPMMLLIPVLYGVVCKKNSGKEI